MESRQFQYEYPLCLPAPRRRHKWLPALILAVMFALGCVTFYLIPMGNAAQPPSNGDASEETVSDSCFLVSNGVLSFDLRKYNGEPILVIPAFVGDEKVTAISDECFRGVTGFTTLLLPNTVTQIGAHAFADCTDLRGVLVPEGVASIGEGAFYGCSKLESVYMPLSVSRIGANAFEGCPRLLYIFYNGFYHTWIDMYDQFITPYTWVMCLDGDFLHGANAQ